MPRDRAQRFHMSDAEAEVQAALRAPPAGDACSEDGALRVKQRIEEYWRARGYDVTVQLVYTGFNAAVRAGRYDLRSDMINGMPVKAQAAEAPAA